MPKRSSRKYWPFRRFASRDSPSWVYNDVQNRMKNGEKKRANVLSDYLFARFVNENCKYRNEIWSAGNFCISVFFSCSIQNTRSQECARSERPKVNETVVRRRGWSRRSFGTRYSRLKSRRLEWSKRSTHSLWRFFLPLNSHCVHFK